MSSGREEIAHHELDDQSLKHHSHFSKMVTVVFSGTILDSWETLPGLTFCH